MKATSKSDEDIWYGLRLPARRCAASLSASAGNGRTGSTGRCVPLGGAASAIFFSADATTSHASSMRTTRASARRLSSLSSTTEVIPTTPPSAAKTGPPALPDARLEVGHDRMRLDAADGSRRHALLLAQRRADGEELLPFAPAPTSPLPRIRAAPAATDATAFGSIPEMATSRAGSAARTLAAHFDGPA